MSAKLQIVTGTESVEAPPIEQGQIAEIVGLPVTADWKIEDSIPEKSLGLIHYTETSQDIRFSNVRGWIADTKHRVVISRSHGFIPTLVADQLKVTAAGQLEIHDQDSDDVLTFDPAKIQITTGFEGTRIRIIKHDNEIYMSTHHKINAKRSYLPASGTRTTFVEMYTQLGGPIAELFGQNKYSPYCYTFIIVHPIVLLASKVNVKDGFLVYLGCEQMWDPNSAPYPADEVDHFRAEVSVTSQRYEPDLPDLAIISAAPMTVAEANQHLQTGFWPDVPVPADERLGLGEFIIITSLENPQEVYQVHSKAYAWRFTMRNACANYYQRFVNLWSSALDKFNRVTRMVEKIDAQRFGQKFPLLPVHPIEAVKSWFETQPYLLAWPASPSEFTLQSVLEGRREDRFENIWRCFIMSVPLHMQKEASTYLERFLTQRKEALDWVNALAKKQSLQGLDLKPRVIAIINIARANAKSELKESPNVEPGRGRGRGRGKAGTRAPNYNTFLYNNVKNLINKEEGNSLYTNIFKCKKQVEFKMLQAQKKAQEATK